VGYPTLNTIDDWDDASLFAFVGCQASLLQLEHGFSRLNDVERAMFCFYRLEAEVNNGGFGQWIYSICPQSAAETLRVLQLIGATEMASFVSDVLLLMGDTTRLLSQEEWIDHYMALPDEVHERFDPLSIPFLKLEEHFLELTYAYTRAHWQNVQAPGDPLQ
jgi:hypothetical protein